MSSSSANAELVVRRGRRDNKQDKYTADQAKAKDDDDKGEEQEEEEEEGRGQEQQQLVEAGRLSGTLQSPTMKLEGHHDGVTSLRFSPDQGHVLASGSMDSRILLWRVFGECVNFGELTGHEGAVTEIDWSHENGVRIYSGSADQTCGVWDVEEEECIRTFHGHERYVNGVCASRSGPELLCSASDDATCRVWDARIRAAFINDNPQNASQEVMQFPHPFAVCSVACGAAELLSKGKEKEMDFGDLPPLEVGDTEMAVYTGSIDNLIRAWDMRKPNECMFILEGHRDTISGLGLSSDCTHLVSVGMEGYAKTWDVRPFVPGSSSNNSNARNRYVLPLGKENIEKTLTRCSWSPNDRYIAVGTNDRMVHVYDADSGQVLYRLPGHIGAVTDVRIHPREPIIASSSLDHSIFIGEVNL